MYTCAVYSSCVFTWVLLLLLLRRRRLLLQDAGPAADASNLSEEELDAIAGYENTIVNAAGEILTIPQYDGPPQKRSGGGKKKGKRR